MQTSAIRISESTYRKLQEISQQKRIPIQTLLDQAIEAYRRQLFLEGLSADFATLHRNKSEWLAEKKERSAWDLA
jgi:predicted transcriptional regulator